MPLSTITAKMAYKPNQEYETAQSRISSLLGQIKEQVQAIATSEPTEVNDIIAEQDKSYFIFKQTELISAYRDRDVFDDRDSYIAKLEEDLKKSEGQVEYYKGLWYKELQTSKSLKSALHSLTTVLTQD